MSAYREDMSRAWDRINSFPTQRLETRFGTIEYADQGDGPPLLVSHGVLGCHVDTVGTGWASLPGPGFRVIGRLASATSVRRSRKAAPRRIRRTRMRCCWTTSGSIVPS